LSADKATVIACHNKVSAYWQAGMRINQPTAPVVAIGNSFSSQEGHQGVVAPTNQGILEDNRVEKTAAPK
jgi:hypothetical protein